MRTYTHAFFGLVLGATLIVLAGCAQDDTSAPPVHNMDLGTRQGEVLVPYEPAISRKVTAEPSQYPLPAMPTAIAAEAPGTQASPAGDPYSGLARQVVDDLSKGNYDGIVARFDAALKARMPAAQLQSMWDALISKSGAFQSQEPAIRQQLQGQEVAIVPCKFEKAPLDIMIAFNANKEITDLSAMPPQMRSMVTGMAANMPGPDSIFAEPGPNTPQLPASPEAADMAKEVAAQLTTGDYAAIEARLTDGAKARLKQPLQAKWEAAVKELGQFKRVGEIDGRKVDKNGQSYNAAMVKIDFEKGMAMCMVAFEADKKIAELWLIPVNAGDIGQAMQGMMQNAMPGMPAGGAPGSQPAEAPATPEAAPAAGEAGSAAPATPTAPGASPAPARPGPARQVPARPARGQPAKAPGAGQPASPVTTPRSAAGMTGSGMGELPPTAPAPVGLGN
jgi:hypothetical protein